jgi:hypothetical protein
MTVSVRRWLLAIVAAVAVFVGAWALSGPADWYASFPGAGHHWLPMLGPYNEHLIRDVGALYLAMAALTVGAALRPADGYLVRLTGVAWLVFSVPHLIYHLGHLEHYATIDRVGNVLSLGAFVLAGAALLLPVGSRSAATASG